MFISRWWRDGAAVHPHRVPLLPGQAAGAPLPPVPGEVRLVQLSSNIVMDHLIQLAAPTAVDNTDNN